MKDAQVVLINGPAGVGKTAVGRALAALVPNGACIHGDCLKNSVVTRMEGAVEGSLGYKNGAVEQHLDRLGRRAARSGSHDLCAVPRRRRAHLGYAEESVTLVRTLRP